MISKTSSISAVVAGAIAATLALSPASAQQIVARVNGDPITAVDLAQRSRLLQLSNGGKAVSRQQALDELIDQELKLQTARRYKIEVGDAEVNQTLSSMAARTGNDLATFSRQLETAGISVTAFRRKLLADVAWSNIVRGKFQADLQVRERDVTDALKSRGGDVNAVAQTYTLRPIVFVVPRGAAPAVYESRKREADALRARFQNCDEGLRLARGMRDTVVREPLTRSSGDVGVKQREILDGTALGRLTPPDVTANGIEVFAVCNKVAGKGAVGAERDIREQMMGDKITAQGKNYLRQLRRQSSIQMQ